MSGFEKLRDALLEAIRGEGKVSVYHVSNGRAWDVSQSYRPCVVCGVGPATKDSLICLMCELDAKAET